MEEGSLFQRMKQIFQGDDEEKEALGQEAAELIRNIFRYMDKDARDIMTHRRDIVAIDGEETLEEALKFMLEESHSRFPIYQEDIDGIIGTMHLREAMRCYFNEEQRQKSVKELKDYIRPVTFIPETKSIDTLFKEMQAGKQHVVIVLDEYGQTAGLVAMEDILEEIVGEINDEYDEKEETYTKLSNNTYIFEACTLLNDFIKIVDADPDSFKDIEGEADTLAGLILEIKGELPGKNDVITYQSHKFTILEVDNRRIKKIKYEKN